MALETWPLVFSITPYYSNDLAPLHLMSIKCPAQRERAGAAASHELRPQQYFSPLWLQTTEGLRVNTAGKERRAGGAEQGPGEERGRLRALSTISPGGRCYLPKISI